jgi:hypothetical protein
MKLIYTPQGAPEREWTIIPTELLSFQSDWLEEAGGDTWESYDEWARLCWSGSRKAIRALLYVMLRTEQPGLRFAHLVTRINEVRVEWERVDLDVEATRQRIENDPDLTEERRAEMLAELADPKDDPDGSEDEPADSVTSEPDTAST